MFSKQISRRSFLKGGLAGAAALGISRLPMPTSVRGADTEELATLIDIRKCIGCEACVEACQETNASKFPEPVKPFPKMFPKRVKAEDWSDKRDVRSLIQEKAHATFTNLINQQQGVRNYE